MMLFEGCNEVKARVCELSKLATEKIDLSKIDTKKLDAPLAKEVTSIETKSKDSHKESDTIPSSSELTIDSERVRTDDNGKIHQKYNQEGKRWELLPNEDYTVNGYHYKTDVRGNIVSASGILQEKKHEGRLPITDEIPNRKETDDRGHLIADMFNGSNRIDNIVPMNMDVNRKQYRAMEDRLRDELQLGKEVKVSVAIAYDNTENRPTKFIVNSIIDGVRQPKRVFLNESTNEGVSK